MGLFKKTRRHSLTITRAISEMETVQVLMTADDSAEFDQLLIDAETAIQWRADQYQAQLVAADKARADELAARAESRKAGK